MQHAQVQLDVPIAHRVLPTVLASAVAGSLAGGIAVFLLVVLATIFDRQISHPLLVGAAMGWAGTMLGAFAGYWLQAKAHERAYYSRSLIVIAQEKATEQAAARS